MVDGGKAVEGYCYRRVKYNTSGIACYYGIQSIVLVHIDGNRVLCQLVRSCGADVVSADSVYVIASYRQRKGV